MVDQESIRVYFNRIQVLIKLMKVCGEMFSN